jgi:hypothetical protein
VRKMSDVCEMEDGGDESTTGVLVGTAGCEKNVIRIRDPSFFSTSIRSRLSKRSLLIDRCVIRYVPQCPVTTRGYVTLEINDNRVKSVDSCQARFIFPILCPVVITYYGTSYAPKSRNCPWEAVYHISGSNLVKDVEFCKIKAQLSFSEDVFYEEVEIRPPSIEVRSKVFNVDSVSVWHATPIVNEPPPLLLKRSASVGPVSKKIVHGTVSSGRRSFDTIRPPSRWVLPSAIQNTGPSDDVKPEDSVSNVCSGPSPDLIGLVIGETSKATASAVMEAQKAKRRGDTCLREY